MALDNDLLRTEASVNQDGGGSDDDDDNEAGKRRKEKYLIALAVFYTTFGSFVIGLVITQSFLSDLGS